MLSFAHRTDKYKQNHRYRPIPIWSAMYRASLSLTNIYIPFQYQFYTIYTLPSRKGTVSFEAYTLIQAYTDAI